MTPSLRMMDQAVGLSGSGGRIRTSRWWIGIRGRNRTHSPIREKRSNHFPSTSHKLLETFQFREPYESSGIQRFGEKRAFRRKIGRLYRSEGWSSDQKSLFFLGSICQPVYLENTWLL